jgi:hypothetical protein
MVRVYRARGLQDKFGLSEYRERYAGNLHRELLCVFFGFATDDCHPDEAESSPQTLFQREIHEVKIPTLSTWLRTRLGWGRWRPCNLTQRAR